MWRERERGSLCRRTLSSDFVLSLLFFSLFPSLFERGYRLPLTLSLPLAVHVSRGEALPKVLRLWRHIWSAAALSLCESSRRARKSRSGKTDSPPVTLRLSTTSLLSNRSSPERLRERKAGADGRSAFQSLARDLHSRARERACDQSSGILLPFCFYSCVCVCHTIARRASPFALHPTLL